MKEFVMIRPSFKERILFLVAGLIDKKHLINTASVTVKVPERVAVIEEDVQQTVIEEVVMDDQIPFFDLDTSKVKSNL